jgi:hypothetical protein
LCSLRRRRSNYTNTIRLQDISYISLQLETLCA